MLSLLQRPRALFQQWSETWLSRRLPKSRSLRLNQKRVFILPTREGLGFLMMLLAIFIGGINYANSLILAIAFLLVSLFLVSILHTFANLSGLQISAGRTENACVGEDAVFWLSLNSPDNKQYESIRLTWGEGKAETVDLIDAPQQQVRMLIPMKRRGRFFPKRLKVETCFPLGLLRAWSWIDMDMNCLVYPKPISNTYPGKLSSSGRDGDQLIRDGSDDFDGLKAYSAGDNPRHISWKTFARSGELYSKVFIGYEDQEHWLDWHAYADEGELRLSKLCYWVIQMQEQQHRFGLRLPNLEIPPGQGNQHCFRCLEALALYGSDVVGGKAND